MITGPRPCAEEGRTTAGGRKVPFAPLWAFGSLTVPGTTWRTCFIPKTADGQSPPAATPPTPSRAPMQDEARRHHRELAAANELVRLDRPAAVVRVEPRRAVRAHGVEPAQQRHRDRAERRRADRDVARRRRDQAKSDQWLPSRLSSVLLLVRVRLYCAGSDDQTAAARNIPLSNRICTSGVLALGTTAHVLTPNSS